MEYIFYSDLIESTIVNAGPKRFILLLHKKNPAPKGDVEGQIIPEDKESTI